MSKKMLIAGIMAGVMTLGAVPTFAATHTEKTNIEQQANQGTDMKQKGQPPKMKNGEQLPEPPKDKDGNPLPPPDGKNAQNANHDGQTPPEPPKDKDGNPLPPPDGVQHGQKDNK